MLSAVFGLIALGSIGIGIYALLERSELRARLSNLQAESLERERQEAAELDRLTAELAKLEKIRHIPNLIERSKRLDAEIAAKLQQAQKEADEAVLVAHKDIERMKARIAAREEELQQRAVEIIRTATQQAEAQNQRILTEIADDSEKAKEARRVAEIQARGLLESAEQQAKEIASQARKEAKEKTRKVEETLSSASRYALEIRDRAERRAEEIAVKAYEAMGKLDFYEAAAVAMQNVVERYGSSYLVPAEHVVDELAEEYSFHRAGERLKVARQRTALMEKDGAAATCNYPEGWKRDYAIQFVLGAFNGKVDSVLARVKPANHGKLVQEIKDTFALVNHNGEVFRSARIRDEFLEARLEELKWAVAVQRLKDKDREEQRAIREQMREEERARKEYERAIKQAQRDEDLLARALDKARQEYASASEEDRAKYESRLQDLSEKLKEAEEKNQRAISMAQQTKCGHVYVISNEGSFGEDVYKIGMTRRLDPLDRVRELGSASVPFAFDVHAMIYSEDAPALEAALHRRFVQNQVNKVNRRKEFFRLKIQDIRSVVEEMKYDARWTVAAEARDYRETLEMERRLRDDPAYRERWSEEQSRFEQGSLFDDEEDSEGDDLDRENAQPSTMRLGAALR